MIYQIKPEQFNPVFEVVSCFFYFEGEILLLHRPSHKSEGNKWGVPGGKIDAGETKMQAMIREIKEETGLELLAKDIEFIETVYVKYEHMDFLYHMFKADFQKRPEIKLRDVEHDEYLWTTPENSLTMDLITDMDPCVRYVYKINEI